MTYIRHIALAAFIATSSTAFAAQELVSNGSLTGSIINNGVPTGWTVFEGTPDIMDAMNNVGLTNIQRFGATPTASFNGGTWVGLGAYGSYMERFGQTLGGLTVGQQYTVSWEAANFGYTYEGVNYLGTNAISVQVDGATVGTGAQIALGSNWYKQSLTFTAQAATQQLAFILASSSQKAYMSIDGISVQVTQAVPEPSTWALMGLGLFGIAVASRRKA
jgi:hypothetical protein